MVIYHRC